MSKSTGSSLARWFDKFRQARCGVFFLGKGLKPLYAQKHETENLISMCRSPRHLFLVISAMICVRLRDDGTLVGSDVDYLAARLESFANELGQYWKSDESNVSDMIGFLGLPARIQGELNALGFSRFIFLSCNDRDSVVREHLRHFSGLTGLNFVFGG